MSKLIWWQTMYSAGQELLYCFVSIKHPNFSYELPPTRLRIFSNSLASHQFSQVSTEIADVSDLVASSGLRLMCLVRAWALCQTGWVPWSWKTCLCPLLFSFTHLVNCWVLPESMDWGHHCFLSLFPDSVLAHLSPFLFPLPTPAPDFLSWTFSTLSVMNMGLYHW